MILRFSKHFLRNYSKAPKAVSGGFRQTVAVLPLDLHHPSLHAKKYDEARDLWQARVNYVWRFYFRIVGDVYLVEEPVPVTIDSYCFSTFKVRSGDVGRLGNSGNAVSSELDLRTVIVPRPVVNCTCGPPPTAPAMVAPRLDAFTFSGSP
jgi:hypothetical protein